MKPKKPRKLKRINSAGVPYVYALIDSTDELFIAPGKLSLNELTRFIFWLVECQIYIRHKQEAIKLIPPKKTTRKKSATKRKPRTKKPQTEPIEEVTIEFDDIEIPF